MTIFDDDQKSMLDVYLYETNQLFEQLDKILIESEKQETINKEDIHSIFRIMHTTKRLIIHDGIRWYCGVDAYC